MHRYWDHVRVLSATIRNVDLSSQCKKNGAAIVKTIFYYSFENTV